MTIDPDNRLTIEKWQFYCQLSLVQLLSSIWDKTLLRLLETGFLENFLLMEDRKCYFIEDGISMHIWSRSRSFCSLQVLKLLGFAYHPFRMHTTFWFVPPAGHNCAMPVSQLYHADDTTVSCRWYNSITLKIQQYHADDTTVSRWWYNHGTVLFL